LEIDGDRLRGVLVVPGLAAAFVASTGPAAGAREGAQL